MDSPALIAAEVLWTTFAPVVCRLLCQILGPNDGVDDDALDVILAVTDNLPLLAEDAPVMPLVLSATARVACRRLRRNRWVKRASAGEVNDDVLRLYGVMNALRTRDRVAFALRFISGLEIEEVASAVGWSPLRARRRLDRAWAKLARLVEHRSPVLSDRSRPALVSWALTTAGRPRRSRSPPRYPN